MRQILSMRITEYFKMELKDVHETFESLKTVFTGLDFCLKDEQAKIILGILKSQNVFGLLPTGYGKSMCYILPPLLLDEMDWTIKHTAVVISPLKSLMEDQVATLKDLGIPALAVQPEIYPECAKELAEGKLSLLFISPESADSSFWRKQFLSDSLSCVFCLLAFDEAHCISEWGDDFRPTYKDVVNLRSVIDAPVLVCTGTCDEKIKTDIFKSLGLCPKETVSVAIVPDRPNIYLDVRRSKEDHEKDLDWLLRCLLEAGRHTKKTIIYCRSVNATAKIYNYFKYELTQAGKDGSLVDMFHRTIDQTSQERILDDFRKVDSSIRILVATIAFGMGIQISDIELVVHWGVPKSALSYWQEVGRAGRNGGSSYAILYAYGRSLVKSLTNEDMISIVKTMLSGEKCVRGGILNLISVDEMTKFTSKTQSCNCKCVPFCICDLCRCCSSCFEKCKCTKKAIEKKMYPDLFDQ